MIEILKNIVRYLLLGCVLSYFVMQQGIGSDALEVNPFLQEAEAKAVFMAASGPKKADIGKNIAADTTADNGKSHADSEKKHNSKDARLVVNPYQAYTYDQMLKDAKELVTLYPDIIKLDTIGKSAEGRDLLVIKLGNGDKKITLNASHHAREYISTTVLMKMVETYARYYADNRVFEGFDVKKLLNQVTIYFVPMVNPDGVTLVQQGPDKLVNSQFVKSLNKSNTNYKSWKANGRGVDLNYQYPYGWEQIKKLNGPASERYKGKAPATEPEVKAMMEFTEKNPFLIHVAYHTQGEIIYWYNGQTGDLLDLSYNIGIKLSRLTGYKLLSKTDQLRSYGGYKDWTVTTFKKPGFTIELCPYAGNYPYPDSKFDDAWSKAASTGLFFAQEAVNMSGYDYEVYEAGSLVQVFNTEEDALDFAQKNSGSSVKKDGQLVWSK